MNSPKRFEIDANLFASNGKRFANYIIDLVVIYILIFSLIIALILVTSMLNIMVFLEWIKTISNTESYLIFFMVYIPYYGLLEGYNSRSIGKFVTKTIVVMKDGSKPDYATTFKRAFCRIIPFEQLSFLSAYSRGIHDSMSNTYVVNKEEFDKATELYISFEEIGTFKE